MVDNFLIIVLILLLVYPYWLVMRFLQLGCKAFKKYLRDEYEYSYFEDEDDD